MPSIADQIVANPDNPDATGIDPASLQNALLDGDGEADLIAGLMHHLPNWHGRSATALNAMRDVAPSDIPRWIIAATPLQKPSFDEQIDDWLDSDDTRSQALDGLVRSGANWSHPALLNALSEPGECHAAATLLSRTGAPKLERSLDEIDDISALLECLRAISLTGSAQWFSALMQWRDHLVDDLSTRDRHRLDGALATVDPERYARRALAGDLGHGWLSDDRSVADFVARHGASAWVPALALFRDTRQRSAFELTAAFATATAFIEPFQDIPEARLDPSEASQWIAEQPATVAFALALSDQDEFAELLVASALHQTLRDRQITPPAIAGLPLSGPLPDPDDLPSLFQSLDDGGTDDPVPLTALVRTLTDLHRLIRRDHISSAVGLPILERYADRHPATAKLWESATDHHPVGGVGDWGCRGLDAQIWHLDSPFNAALNALAQGWLQGPVERAHLAEALFDTRLGAHRRPPETL